MCDLPLDSPASRFSAVADAVKPTGSFLSLVDRVRDRYERHKLVTQNSRQGSQAKVVLWRMEPFRRTAFYMHSSRPVAA